MPRPYAPYEMPWMGPDFRPPGRIGRADPHEAYPPVPRSRPGASQRDQPEPKAAAAPAQPNAAVVTVGPSAASRAADPKPTTSLPEKPSFPPVQSLERTTILSVVMPRELRGTQYPPSVVNTRGGGH